MAARGVHFAITDEALTRLLAVSGDDERRAVIEVVERTEWGVWSIETDKAWDAIHRCLNNGELIYDVGDHVAARGIVGGEQLYAGDDYIISLVRGSGVAEVAAAMERVTEQEMRTAYEGIEGYAPEWGDQDWEYTWEYFKDLPAFFRRAAEAGRHVIFTVSQ